MTVSTLTSEVRYAGNGATTSFAIPFRFDANADIVATLVDDVTGAETLWSLGDDYTLAGALDPAGGTLTATTAPAAANTLVIERVMALTQSRVFNEGSLFPAKSFEGGLDRSAMMIQQLSRRVDRGVRAPLADPAALVALPIISARKDRALAFDAAGQPSAGPLIADLETAVTAALGGLSIGDIPSVANLAAMTALAKATLTDKEPIQVLGALARGDGGGGLFYWDAAASDTADGGTILAADEAGAGRWKRVFSGAIDARWFGLQGDGVSDDRAALQAAINAAANGVLRLPAPAVAYKVNATINLISDIEIVGDGRESHIDGAAVLGAVFLAIDKADIALRDLRIDYGSNQAEDVGIDLQGVHRARVEGCSFANADSLNNTAAIRLSSTNRSATRGCHDIHIAGNRFVSNGLAILSQSASADPNLRVAVVANHFATSQTANSTITNGQVKIDQFTEHATIADNIGDGGGVFHDFIQIEQAVKHAAVVGNVAVNFTESGINIGDGSVADRGCENVSIAANALDRCGIIMKVGQVSAHINVAIVDNVIDAAPGIGIDASQNTLGTSNCRIAGNLVRGAGGIGIVTDGEIDVVGNAVLASVASGYQLEGASHNIFANNRAENCGGSDDHSMLIRDCVACLIAGNVARSATARAAAAQNTEILIVKGGAGPAETGSLHIADNIVDTASATGIFIGFGVVASTVVGGRIAGNTGAAIAAGTLSDHSIMAVSGYATFATGLATVVSGTTSIVVNHGLAAAPPSGGVQVTPGASLGAAARFWISAIGAASFTINVDANPAANVDFHWAARALI